MSSVKNYTVFDADSGLIVRHLCMPAEFVKANMAPNCVVREGQFDQLTERLDIDTGDIVSRVPPPAPSLTSGQLRARSYPDVRDQLDALWKGGAEMEAMRATILAVKAKYPKEAT